MDKRLLIVLPLCLVIVIGWNLLFPPKHVRPNANPSVPAAASSTAQIPPGATAPAVKPAEALPSATLGPVLREESEREIRVQIGKPGEAGSYEAVFTNRGGALKELLLGDYFDTAGLKEAERADTKHWTKLVTQVDTGHGVSRSFLLGTSLSSSALATQPLEDELWTVKVEGSEGHTTAVEFQLAPGTGVVFTKRFTFPSELTSKREIGFQLGLENQGRAGDETRMSFVLTPVACMPAESADQYYIEPQALVCVSPPDGPAEVLVKPRDDTGHTPSDAFELLGRPPLFAGVQNKYFATLFRGVGEDERKSITGASWRALQDQEFVRAHPAEAAKSWRQVVTDLQLELTLPKQGEKRSWSYVLYAGPKSSQALTESFPEQALLTKKDLGFFHSIAAVLLAVLSFLEGLTGNWGVAIILLTILVRGVLFPINRRSQTAMARYQSKMKRIQPKVDELKKRYANDKAKLNQEQAKLLQSEGAFPPLGGSMWIWQQRGMPMPADEQAAKMQKMMMWMPIVMGVFLYNYAAGLSLYMITQSGLGVFEQKFIKKHWPPDTTEKPKKEGVLGRMMAKAQDAQKEAERLKRQRDPKKR
ncbi:MAG: YidC/Oxa1 family insertase periplasmic-domain containing protein [Planctomycetes bacterium]|nr:YidC/Oxa1 family insertase periplasmic-domain containing protein [Planctomycetota bacterium]